MSLIYLFYFCFFDNALHNLFQKVMKTQFLIFALTLFSFFFLFAI